MYIPKKYGESKIDKCPFCGLMATSKNSQDVPVCNAHKESVLPDMKCACGNYLDIRTGKFGLFFNCINCGNVNSRKAFEMNAITDFNVKMNNAKKPNSSGSAAIDNRQIKTQKISAEQAKRIITVRSDDPRYFD